MSSAAQQRFDRILRLLPRTARAAEPETIHHLRTAIRRAEALMELDRPWRRLRRRAGRLRDLDVQVGLLRQLPSSPARRQLLAAMRRERRRRARKLENRLNSSRRRQLAKLLRQAVPRLTPDVATILQRFAALDATYPALAAENLHEFRKRCKQLRYQAEAAGAETELAAACKRIQDAVGAWHDWSELRARAHRELAGAEAEPLLLGLNRATAAHFTAALRQAERERAELRPRLERYAAAPRRPPGRATVAVRAVRAARSA